MAREKKAEWRSDRKKADVLVPVGFIVQVDGDLTFADGTAPTKAQLRRAEDQMVLRYEDKILAAVQKVLGDRVVHFDSLAAYVGHPSSGIEAKIRLDTPAEPAPATPATPAAPAPSNKTDWGAKSVKVLRTECKKAGLKTQGNKTNLVARLTKNDVDNG